MSVSSPRPRVSFAWLAVLFVAYFAAPGYRGVALGGVPLGAAGTSIVAVLVVLSVVLRGIRFPARTFGVCAGAVTLLIVARVAIGATSIPSGWTASYFANEQWAGPPQWSSDFRGLAATRIDRQIAFRDDTFPAHYLNDYAFDRGDRREVTEPMSVEWRAYARLENSQPTRLTLSARGTATMAVDGRTVLTTSALKEPRPVETSVTLAPGPHDLVVRYLKPADTDGLIEAQTIAAKAAAGAPTSLTLTPWPVDRRGTEWLLPVARTIDAMAMLLAAAASAYTVSQLFRRGASADAEWLTLALCALFGIQGWRQAMPFAGRVRPLIAGDDWWGFEMCARDILHHGPLMLLGKPMGEAGPYFYHPFYSYFLAAVHGVTGETFFGPVLVQFLILAAVAAIMWRLARDLFGIVPASVAVAALIVIFELDFARYYTVTLLSENLYVLTVTLAIVPFVRWVREGARADLVRMAFWGGVSTITRPPMLMYLFPALLLVGVISGRRSRRGTSAAAAVALVAAVWLATVAPITARNVLVSKRFILVSDVQSSSVLTYNIPPSVSAADYGARFRGTFGSALNVVGQIGREHPLALLAFEGRKIGFSLGMIHWAGGYRPHPELIAVTVLYLLMCVVSARLRSPELWPVHLFVLVHTGSLLLTMPWNYGYRMILQPYVYTTTLSVAALTAWIGSRRFGLGRSAPIVARA